MCLKTNEMSVNLTLHLSQTVQLIVLCDGLKCPDRGHCSRRYTHLANANMVY